MSKRVIHALNVSAALLLLVGCSSLGFMAGHPDAVAQVSPLDGGTVYGKASFTQQGEMVLVEADLEGLAPGKHGFHIHEHGDCGGVSGASAGAHFDTLGHAHGEPALVTSHEGDLGNLWADSKGHARLSLRSKWLRLSGDQSILGRSIVVHSLPDDLTSQPGGNSGGRIACGLITAAIR